MPKRCLILAALSASFLHAQDDTARRVDDLFRQWSRSESPGASVAVIRDGKILYQNGYGAATLEYNVPVTPETVFHVASVSKQFTAMALVLLEQDRKLSLEDDIRKYLPELPAYRRTVTIRHLLQHTGGIRDQWQTLGIAGWRLDDVITQKQILGMLFRQKELNFEPGSRHLYSNGGYTLAAEIVARVSGKTFPEFTQERIFRPLAMTRTHFHDDHRHIDRDRAYSYEPATGGFRASPLNYANAGATSLFTTAPDLAKWLDNFRDPKVGGAAAVARLQEQAVLTNGNKQSYALGIAVGEYRGLRTLSHGGGDAGYRSYVSWYPGQQFGVVVLSNLSTFNPGNIANRVAEIFLGGQMTAQAAPPKPVARTYVSVDARTLDRFTGYYRLDAGPLIQVVNKDGKLLAAPPGATMQELKPLAATRFYAEAMQAEVEFVAAAAGGMTMKLTQPVGSAQGERVTIVPPDPKDLNSYAGSYWSEELEAQYTIRVKEGRLVADHVRHGEIPLTARTRDEFASGSWFMPEVRFLRDRGGKVTGMTLGGNRVTAIRFARR